MSRHLLPLVLLLLLAWRAAGAAEAAADADSAGAGARADSALAGQPAGGPAPVADSLPLRLRPTLTIGAAHEDRAALGEPSGVACDAFGRIYVTDAEQHRLVRFDAQGTWLGEAGALGSDPGDLRRPAGAAPVGSAGVAVLDRENRRIVLYDLFGRLVGVLADLAALEDDLGRLDPVAIAADRGGALYVVDADRDRVLVLDFSGRFVRTLGGYGTAGGSFRGLSGVGADRRGGLVTTERAGARVQRLDAGGEPLASWPLAVQPGRGALPVAVDESGRIAVADETSGRLWLFSPSGDLLAARDDLARPRGLAFASEGSLLVAEGGAGRVRRFSIESARTAAPPGR